MTTTEYAFRVRCHYCESKIHSDSPAIFDDRYPCCANCELAALAQDPDFADMIADAPVLTPDDEEWWG